MSEVEIDRTIKEVANSIYTTYSGPDNKRYRTDRAQDTDSIAVVGLTREEVFNVNTSSQTRAEKHRDIYLNDRQHVEPKAVLVLDNITDCHGADFDWWEPRAGDFVYIVNLPPEKPELDLIRAFRIRTTEYRPGTEYTDGTGNLLESLVLTPLELPLLDVIVARSQAGAGVY